MNKENSLKEKKRKLNKTHSMQFRILATVIFEMLVITVFLYDFIRGADVP